MKTKALLQAYLDQGCKACCGHKARKRNGVLNIVMGVQRTKLQTPSQHPIVNRRIMHHQLCLAPVVKVLHESIGN